MGKARSLPGLLRGRNQKGPSKNPDHHGGPHPEARDRGKYNRLRQGGHHRPRPRTSRRPALAKKSRRRGQGRNKPMRTRLPVLHETNNENKNRLLHQMAEGTQGSVSTPHRRKTEIGFGLYNTGRQFKLHFWKINNIIILGAEMSECQ